MHIHVVTSDLLFRGALLARQGFQTTSAASSGFACSSTPVEPCRLISFGTCTASPCGGTWDARLVSPVTLIKDARMRREFCAGEVLRVMDRGTQSINNLLSYILFNIAPTLVDIAVAVVYFVIAFDGWFGLIVFTTMISYIYFTISITEWRTKYRR